MKALLIILRERIDWTSLLRLNVIGVILGTIFAYAHRDVIAFVAIVGSLNAIAFLTIASIVISSLSKNNE